MTKLMNTQLHESNNYTGTYHVFDDEGFLPLATPKAGFNVYNANKEKLDAIPEANLIIVNIVGTIERREVETDEGEIVEKRKLHVKAMVIQTVADDENEYYLDMLDGEGK